MSDPAIAGRSSPHPGRADERWLARYRRFALPVLDTLWPTSVSGLHEFPQHDDYILIANHSGLGLVESVCLVGVWLRNVGQHRPIAPMVHSSLFRGPFGDLLRAAGAVEASPAGARWARSHGAALLLFPGGDHEAMRPIWRAREVDFGGRVGWIRLARELELDVVPLAITGSHVTIPNLGFSKTLAWLGPRFVGIHRVPLPVLSIAMALGSLLVATKKRSVSRRVARAWALYLAVALVPFVPSRIRFQILPRMRREELDAADDATIYARITSAIGDVLGS